MSTNLNDLQRAELLQLYKEKLTQLGDDAFFDQFDTIREECYRKLGVDEKSTPFHERAVVASGLISYRYKGRYGWIMIGARNHADALQEAGRSTGDAIIIANLQVWDEAKSCYIEAGETLDSSSAASILGKRGGESKSEAKSSASSRPRSMSRSNQVVDMDDI